MKLTSYLLLLGLCCSAPVYADKVDYDMQKIHSLVEQEKYAEALSMHQVYFAESRDAEGQFGVRLSFALADWAKLGELYPPAMTALQNIAAEHKEQLLDGRGDFDMMMEFASINEYIGDPRATIEVFRAVDQAYPEQSRSLFFAVREELFAQQEYQLIHKFVEDPIYAFEQARNHRELRLSQARKGKYKMDLFQMDKVYSRSVHELLQMTESLGLIEDYDEIKKRHKAYMDLYR
ncbi:hypothetical protein [Gilvimarinus sp. DA14]|uniref:hypothetical protein n=1 Tax=Gilvimarinus sp. DA14 TaxID=2956798 RepID=UPI0020B6FC15|nr:hypothetical protein [Gilvimarinus sp. DA14]UTF61092.1 hypothetical protein NHM04_04640 [Gilvimarinus sp. DA14]